MFGTMSVDFPSKWVQLSDVVSKLIRCEQVTREQWNDSFHDVYALCHSRPSSHAATLYSSTTSLISARVKAIATELESVDDADLLPVYVQHWEMFLSGLTCLDNLYRVVNKQYVKNLRPTEAEMCYSAILPTADRHTMEILEVGLAHWKLYLIDHVSSRISSCLMREVANDRAGIVGQQNCIYPCIRSFLTVGELRDIEKAGMDIYNELFHNPLLSQSKSFYSKWASQRQAELPCPNYVTEALALRQAEEKRVTQYYKCSADDVHALFQQIVVKDRLEFLNQSVQHMIPEEHRTDLHNLYCLLAPNNLYTDLSHWFGKHIMVRIGEALSTLPTDPAVAWKPFVDSLLSLRERFTQFIDEVFDENTAFRDQMDKAFKLAVNERTSVPRSGSSAATTQSNLIQPRPSELLSRYIDNLLRKSAKSMSETEIEAKLKSLITIFKYLDDKDVFQRYYQKMLFKRLISHVPPSMELEELVIGQLKAVCGYEFTGKFHRMFNDIQLGPELNRNFAQYLDKQNVQYKFHHQFSILTQCSWPISPAQNTEFNLPNDVQQCTAHFEQFYSTVYRNRKMRWVHQLSTVELALLYLDKPYQLHAPVMHAAILLQFDATDSDRLALRDLYEQVHPAQSETPDHPNAMDVSTGADVLLAPDLVQRLLGPLLELNLIYLEQDGQVATTLDSMQLGPETWVVLNRTFKNKRLKFRVNATLQTKEAVQIEAHQVEQQVTEDRRYFTKAAIVRIMKARRQSDHASLVSAVVQQASARFHAPTTLIKHCIESLIEQGYLERNPENPSKYNYLA